MTERRASVIEYLQVLSIIKLYFNSYTHKCTHTHNRFIYELMHLTGSLRLFCIRPQLTAAIYSWDRGVTEIDEGISHVRHFHQHIMHELILFISFPKKNLLMFINVTVQYKCTVIKSFKQDRTSPASV